MAKHHPDLVFCRKQPGISLGRLCEKCDGKCVVCDSYVRPHVLVHICDECNYGSFEVPSDAVLNIIICSAAAKSGGWRYRIFILQGRCIICGAPGISDAYYCRECTLQEKDVSLIVSRHLLYNLSNPLWLCYFSRPIIDFVSFVEGRLSEDY